MKVQVAVTLACLGLLLPRAVRAQDVVEYYGLDAIGSVRVIFDSTGAMVGRHDYGPFGEQLAASRFGTKVYAQLFRDGESGQDYAAARMYPTRTGRFNGPDVVYSGLEQPQLWNRYSYAANNPLSLIDPSGLEPQSVNCGLGTYWCPGQIQNGKDGDKYFDPSAYGYHGGEEGARAEAGWVLGLADAWQKFRERISAEKSNVSTEWKLNQCNGSICGPDGKPPEVSVAGVPRIDLAVVALVGAVIQQTPRAAQSIQVWSTRVHNSVANLINGLNNPQLRAEVSYYLGSRVHPGFPGSVRIDAALFSRTGEILRIYDYKLGNTAAGQTMSVSRMAEIYKHLPETARQAPMVIIHR